MDTGCICNTYSAGNQEAIPYVDIVAVLSEDEKRICIFAVNKSLDSACELELQMTGFEGYKAVKHVALEGDDLKAANTAEETDKVTPVEKQVGEKITLAPASWNMIVLEAYIRIHFFIIPILEKVGTFRERGRYQLLYCRRHKANAFESIFVCHRMRMCDAIYEIFCPSCQKATALAAATFKESTPWDMGIHTV